MYDLVLEVSKQTNRTPEMVLQIPVRKFWAEVDFINRRRKEMNRAMEKNPFAGAALAQAGGII